MGRSSRAVAQRHREELVRAAARLFREQDLGSVSVPDVMGEIGLTRGGFYRHFDSKEALVAAAVEATFNEHLARIEGMADEHSGDPSATRQAFVEFCLSPAHRDDPGTGCPSALASGIARSDPDSASRSAFITGMRTLIDELVARIGERDADVDAQQDRILSDLAMLVGALTLARATAGDPISDVILDAVRGRLSREEPSSVCRASSSG